jgi:hypothetical protein
LHFFTLPHPTIAPEQTTAFLSSPFVSQRAARLAKFYADKCRDHANGRCIHGRDCHYHEDTEATETCQSISLHFKIALFSLLRSASIHFALLHFTWFRLDPFHFALQLTLLPREICGPTARALTRFFTNHAIFETIGRRLCLHSIPLFVACRARIRLLSPHHSVHMGFWPRTGHWPPRATTSTITTTANFDYDRATSTSARTSTATPATTMAPGRATAHRTIVTTNTSKPSTPRIVLGRSTTEWSRPTYDGNEARFMWTALEVNSADFFTKALTKEFFEKRRRYRPS